MWNLERDVIAGLVAAGYRVIAVSSPGVLLDRLARELGVATTKIQMSRTVSPAADIRALRSWLRLVRASKPAMVIAGTPKAALLAMVASWMCRVPLRIYGLYGLRLEGARGILRVILWTMEALTAASSSEILAVSHSLKSRYLSLRLSPASKVLVVGSGTTHGVDLAHFQPGLEVGEERVRKELRIPDGYEVVGFVGRLHPDKGLDVLVDACNWLRRQKVDFHLLIIGVIDVSESTSVLAELARCEQPFSLITDASDVRPYYRLMSVHCLPSRREGFPNVVLEAAAMGVPTVTTSATGAVDSVINGKTGLIVPVDDSDALARAIQSLLNDPIMRRAFGTAARDYVSSRYDRQGVVDAYLKHFRRSLDQLQQPNHR